MLQLIGLLLADIFLELYATFKRLFKRLFGLLRIRYFKDLETDI